jgi:hypothetical protein
MSIAVDIAELPEALLGYPWGYFTTVGDDGRAHLLAVPTDWRDGALHLDAGRGSRANAAARPHVTLAFPGSDGTGYSLIVDGVAEVRDEHVTVTPTWAVLHRPALRDD